MPIPRPADHWSEKFPELATPDPRLEILRYELAFADAGHPLTALRQRLEASVGRATEIALPGTAERSFDERWLLAVFEALSTTDLRWYQFLLRSRMGAGDAARMHFAFTRAQVWLDARL